MFKKGKRRGLQRYQCQHCKRWFQNQWRRSKQQRQQLWHEYVWQRTTAEQVAVTAKPVLVEKVVIVADATFWGRGYGMLVFRYPQLKKNLYWKEITTETVEVYRQARPLEAQGCQIQAVVLDGRPGIRKVFADLPVQPCHFQQMATITRYLTRNPKLPGGQELRQIMLSLPRTTELLFTKQLTQ